MRLVKRLQSSPSHLFFEPQFGLIGPLMTVDRFDVGHLARDGEKGDEESGIESVENGRGERERLRVSKIDVEDLRFGPVYEKIQAVRRTDLKMEAMRCRMTLQLKMKMRVNGFSLQITKYKR